MSMKSPVSYLTDEQYAALPIEERALHLAHADIGKGEEPKGSNWGNYVRFLLARCGLHAPAPWCAAFVTDRLVTAGSSMGNLPDHPASTWWWLKWAKDRGRSHSTPRRGMLFCWNDNGAGHIGFVAGVDLAKHTVRTIEGNTNDDGSREGWGVFERDRSIESILSRKGGTFIDVRRLV